VIRIIDPVASFVTWRVDTLRKPPTIASHRPPRTLNNARAPLDCICHVRDARTGARDRLLLGTSCKTERVGVEDDVWTTPNADFVPVVGDEEFLAIKTYPRAGMSVPLHPPGSGDQPERQLVRSAEAFDSVRVHLAEVEADELEDPAGVVEAVLAGRRLVAHTELRLDGLEARLEYPVKTINVNERDVEYQTDTGPLVVPLGPIDGSFVAAAELCFIASNRPDRAELLVRVPTPVADGVEVHHYSRVVKVDARSRTFALR
jgi:hypothetical protein